LAAPAHKTTLDGWLIAPSTSQITKIRWLSIPRPFLRLHTPSNIAVVSFGLLPHLLLRYFAITSLSRRSSSILPLAMPLARSLSQRGVDIAHLSSVSSNGRAVRVSMLCAFLACSAFIRKCLVLDDSPRSHLSAYRANEQISIIFFEKWRIL